MQKIKGLKDVPIQIHDNDALGLSDYAKALSAFILSADTPITIGIHGDWGSGKSSLMYLLEQKIKADCQDNKLYSLWFNAWQFSQMGEPLSVSLLSHFIDEIERLGKGGRQHSLEAAKKALIKEPSKNIRDLKREISNLVAETLINENNRIVVFIDDIGRLVSEKALDLLEALKLFLELKGCVFVLACDYQVIAKGLKQKFNLSENDLKGFFEKMIQVRFNMPVSQYNAQGFLTTMLDEHLGVTYSTEQDKNDDAVLYLKLVTYSAGFNPRTVKWLFNNLLLLKFVLEAKGVLKSDKVAHVNEKMRILFATLCLQHSFSAMYNNLLYYLQDVGEAENITDEKVTETNEFFRELRKSETFRQEEGEFAEKKVGNAYQLANFMGAFFDAIQLKSDTSEIADDMLNADEMATLNNIMSFSVAIVGTPPPPPPEWTGYWFVNVGDWGYRTWEDNRKYGFISAGQSVAFKRLSVGDKIYAYVKERGYVGFGEIIKEAVMIKDFMVPKESLLPAKLNAAGENSENEQWVVSVKWLKTVPKEQAKTFSGVFANQNVVCKLRHEQTLRFVHKHFGK
ncbi:MAG: P-loop NTPase fold protein [Pseudomonadota bacterium]